MNTTHPNENELTKAILDTLASIPLNELTVERIEQHAGCDKKTAEVVFVVMLHHHEQLREKINLLVQHQDPTLDAFFSACKTFEEANDLLGYRRLLHGESGGDSSHALSEEWKQKAREAFGDVPVDTLKTSQIQVRLKVGYSLALRIKEWLQGARD